MSQAQAMIDSLRAVTAVAIAEIDLSGLLLDANAGYLRQLPARSHPAPGIAVAPSLISPSFARLIELSSSGAETLYEGLMTLGDPTGKSRSFRGSVSRTERGLFLLLEYDVEELSHVAETALELSSELAQAQRAVAVDEQPAQVEGGRTRAIRAAAETERIDAGRSPASCQGWELELGHSERPDPLVRRALPDFWPESSRVGDDLRTVPDSCPPGRPGDRPT